MNPITHLFVGWTVAEQLQLAPRDRALVAWSGVVADFDGLSIVPDMVNKLLGRPATDYYFQYHHFLGHGLPVAILATILAFVLGTRKWKAALFAFLAFHLHLLCDLVGSRGPTSADIWPVGYLQPFSDSLTFEWSGQWALNAWPNITLTLVLMVLIFFRAFRRGYSPVSLLSKRADQAFVATLRARFGRDASPAPELPEEYI